MEVKEDEDVYEPLWHEHGHAMVVTIHESWQGGYEAYRA